MDFKDRLKAAIIEKDYRELEQNNHLTTDGYSRLFREIENLLIDRVRDNEDITCYYYPTTEELIFIEGEENLLLKKLKLSDYEISFKDEYTPGRLLSQIRNRYESCSNFLKIDLTSHIPVHGESGVPALAFKYLKDHIYHDDTILAEKLKVIKEHISAFKNKTEIGYKSLIHSNLQIILPELNSVILRKAEEGASVLYMHVSVPNDAILLYDKKLNRESIPYNISRYSDRTKYLLPIEIKRLIKMSKPNIQNDLFNELGGIIGKEITDYYTEQGLKTSLTYLPDKLIFPQSRKAYLRIQINL